MDGRTQHMAQHIEVSEDASVSALYLENVSKHFGATTALDAISFDVQPGEVHCLAGENGCGKSTLIKIVTGVYRPEAGAIIRIFNKPLAHITPPVARGMGIAVIWQDLALFPHMSVAENICVDEMVGVLPRLVDTRSMRDRSSTILERLGVTLDVSVSLKTLPIAQRQIVAIARALVGQARLIFMDEPTASLTQNETERLLDIVRSLSADGVAIVFVSHRLAEVLEIASRVTILRDGRLVGVFPTKDMTQTRLGKLMTGTTLSYSVSTKQKNSSTAVLQATGLARSNEFKDINLTIRAGEIVGLIGLIGAGRTELAKALIGMTALDSGTMTLNQTLFKPRTFRDAIKAGVAYVSEDRLALGLIQAQPIADNTAISVLHRLLDALGLLSNKKKSLLVEHWVDELSIKIGHSSDQVSTLSGGNQQRVVLAKWLATEPKLLILDSPTVGVDVGARAGIFKIINTLAERGIAILLISDEVTEVLFNSDRILHMADGQLKDEYLPGDISAEFLESRIYA